mmetsp:Transcript_6626/g.8993  ORF Transcript_6626/g.8993 Transcript_6626/m.8993 type:complete len:128 (+) Transcript_6626:1-384(+)
MDGCMCVWATEDNNTAPAVIIKVPYCGGTNIRSLFGFTPSGDFLVAGNAAGDLYVFDSFTGGKVCTLKHEKVSAPVRACAITDDCSHVLAVYGSGFVWRYEFIPPQIDFNEDKVPDDPKHEISEEES